MEMQPPEPIKTTFPWSTDDFLECILINRIDLPQRAQTCPTAFPLLNTNISLALHYRSILLPDEGWIILLSFPVVTCTAYPEACKIQPLTSPPDLDKMRQAVTCISGPQSFSEHGQVGRCGLRVGGRGHPGACRWACHAHGWVCCTCGGACRACRVGVSCLQRGVLHSCTCLQARHTHP